MLDRSVNELEGINRRGDSGVPLSSLSSSNFETKVEVLTVVTAEGEWDVIYVEDHTSARFLQVALGGT